MASIFADGKYDVELRKVPAAVDGGSDSSPLPPRPLLVATPKDTGEYPTVLFLHGFLLQNSFYSQLLRQIATHGFIVVAIQFENSLSLDATDDIKAAAATADWFLDGLSDHLPSGVKPNLKRLALGGHSRGGKVSFALALGIPKDVAATRVRFSAIVGIDPVDGLCRQEQTTPHVLSHKPKSFNLGMPALVTGSSLGGEWNLFLCPCAPKGLSHAEFFNECRGPAWHMVGDEYGHMDVLDDDTPGPAGKLTYIVCRKGKAREPMRRFAGGAVVAFLNDCLKGDPSDIKALMADPGLAPVKLEPIEYRGPPTSQVGCTEPELQMSASK